VVAAAAAAWGGDASRVGVRLSPNSAFNDMGSPDYAAQFAAAAAAVEPAGLGYLHVVDGVAYGAPHALGPPVTLRDARAGGFRGAVVANCGYTPATAAAAVAAGDAAAVAFGRSFISNPDLPARIRAGWPLAPDASAEEWYAPVGPRGYTDFPPYAPRS
jgi:N-ethylmaleimide reductase